MGDDDKSSLNFDSAQLENAAVGATRAFDLIKDALLPGLSLLLFVAAVVATALAVRRKSKGTANWRPISEWTPGAKIALVPLLASYFLTHVFAAASVYYNTKIANSSSEEYWTTLGVGRLFSLSHAHLFAHATMYFLLAILVQFTRRGGFFKAVLPAVALWAGVFDVVGWWGMKLVSPNFEIVSAATGSGFSVAFLIMTFAIFDEARRHT